MKNTAFTNFHIELGAKMAPFAGFNMPISYFGINEEHKTVRNALGVFDVSHMGEFWVEGPNAANFIQKLTTNNVTDLWDGKVHYTCFPNGQGGIVDDLLVYKVNDEKYLLVVNGGCLEKDWDWVVKNANEMGIEVGKEVYNESDNTAQLAVQGPLALQAMQKLTDTKITDMEFYTFKIIDFAGMKNVLFATTGYTGSGGCEIYIPNEDGAKLWNAVFEAGKEFGIKPIGLAARDTLRLEMGYCLYGNDISMETSPIEAGLGWITKFVDGNDFIDRDKMEILKQEGVTKRLKGFEMIDKGVPRQHYEICDKDGNNIGEVTSGTITPMLEKGVGMGYINKGYNKVDTEIYIKVRNKLLKAKVAKMPFYRE